MERSFLNLCIVACIAFVFIQCAGETNKTPVQAAAPAKAYDTVIARRQAIVKTLQLNGELMAVEKSTILSKVNGYIKKVSVDIGQQVRKGQTLAIIDAPEMAAQLAQANSQARMAASRAEATKAHYDRLLTASSTAGAVSANELEQAKSQMNADVQAYQAALAARNSYMAMGGYLVLKSPFNGIVTTRGVNSGDYVDNSGKVLFEVEDLRMLRLQVPVPEAYVASHLGDNRAGFTVSAFPGKLFTATLVRKSGAISSNTRSETWEFEVENADRKLKAGMFAELQLPLQREEEGILLPNSAFVTNQERMFVIRVKDGKAEWVDVKKGFSLAKESEVMGPVQPGDVILKSATDEIKDGGPIVVK